MHEFFIKISKEDKSLLIPIKQDIDRNDVLNEMRWER